MFNAKSGTLSITIINDSGSTASYSIFCEAPEVVPAPPSCTIATKVIASLRGVPNRTGEATCTFAHTELVAVCGINNDLDQDDGNIKFSILDKRPIVLAYREDDGTLSPGSQTSIVFNDDTPQFLTTEIQNGAAALSETGCFYIETPSGFTCQQARSENYIVGVGLRKGAMSRRLAAYYASFTPAPSTIYQVKPSQKFYVVCGKYPNGSAVTPRMVSMACKLDLASLGSGDVQLKHTEQGKLVICTANR